MSTMGVLKQRPDHLDLFLKLMTVLGSVIAAQNAALNTLAAEIKVLKAL